MSAAGQSATQRRIEAQALLVAALTPGSPEHRRATNVLLLLQDALFTLSETAVLLRAARRKTRGDG